MVWWVAKLSFLDSLQGKRPKKYSKLILETTKKCQLLYACHYKPQHVLLFTPFFTGVYIIKSSFKSSACTVLVLVWPWQIPRYYASNSPIWLFRCLPLTNKIGNCLIKPQIAILTSKRVGTHCGFRWPENGFAVFIEILCYRWYAK